MVRPKVVEFHLITPSPSVPGPISSLSSLPSFFKITITWVRPKMPNGVVTGYEVSYWPTDSPMSIAGSFPTNLETSFTTQMKLELGTEYTFTVRAYTGVGPGEKTSTVVTTLERPCEMKFPLTCSSITSSVMSHTAAVQGVKVAPLKDTSVTVSWEALVIHGYPNAVESYTVVYSSVSQHRRRESREMSAVFPSPATSGVITGLDPAVTYQFQVFATAIVENTTLVGERSTAVQIIVKGGSVLY